MLDERILDAFLTGSGTGSNDRFHLGAGGFNIFAIKQERAVYEPVNYLYVKNALSPGISPAVATYALERRVVIIDTRQPAAAPVVEAAESMGLYNTATTTDGIKLYCPLACEDCEMSLRCATTSDNNRLWQAKPREAAADFDGPLFF